VVHCETIVCHRLLPVKGQENDCMGNIQQPTQSLQIETYPM
jgi:hypothetical protein